MDALGVQSTIKSLVAMVLKDGKIKVGFHACLLRRFHQFFVVFLHFIAKEQAFFILFEPLKYLIVRQLLPTGLDGKIRLPIGYDWFGRIAILDNQVTGISGELIIFNLPLAT